MEDIKRYHIIQKCIDKLKVTKSTVNYVEIGVQTGLCFFKIKADKKVAVDPDFIIKPTKKIRAYIENPANFNNKFFELTSDDFFAKQANYLNKIGGIDVIFIDGLHLYEQVVADVENSLKFLNPGGIILLHDCNPASEAAATRGYSPVEIRKNPPPGWTGEWNGDTWKAVVQLRSQRNDLQVTVFDCDYGIGFVKVGTPESTLSFSLEDIQNLTYADLDKSRKEFLNLKNTSELIRYYNAI